MRGLRVFVALTVAILLFSLGAYAAPKEQAGQYKTRDEKVSYGLGHDIGTNLKAIANYINIDILLKGMKDALDGKEPIVPKKEFYDSMNELKEYVNSKTEVDRKALAEKNLAESREFMAKNKKAPGVKTTSSGLQYKIANKGEGDSPGPNDKVVVHYRGKFINGNEFDSSFGRNAPATFPVSGVIKGFSEGLKMMKPGAVWTLYIPPDLGYGEQGAGSKIPPNKALIFEVELISVQH